MRTGRTMRAYTRDDKAVWLRLNRTVTACRLSDRAYLQFTLASGNSAAVYAALWINDTVRVV
jgi:hypothetical protein